MHWVVFILLLLGALFGLAAFAQADAGKARLLWPFTLDSKPIVDFVGGLPKQACSAVTVLLAVLVGLCWKSAPPRGWTALAAWSLLIFRYEQYCARVHRWV